MKTRKLEPPTPGLSPREAYLIHEANTHPHGFVAAVELRTKDVTRGHRRYTALESLIHKGILVEVGRETAVITGIGGRTAKLRELTAQRVVGDSGAAFKNPGKSGNQPRI